jgi:hypothetical protein
VMALSCLVELVLHAPGSNNKFDFLVSVCFVVDNRIDTEA